MKRTLAIFTAALLAGLIATPPSSAQSSDSGPALGVARISLTNGDVTTKRGDSGDWVAASVNTPVVEGDIIETGPGSRVEIQLDYSNLIRLDGSSTLEIAQLGDRNFRVRLLDGRATYSELRNGEADVDVETPFVAVRPRKNGRYEIETRAGETIVQVRRGEAEVASPDGIRRVGKGRMLIIREGPNGLEMREERDEPSGEWDEWNKLRDERLSKSESYRYVSRSVVGADDLDYYGDWAYVSGYGRCWYPRVNAGWSPYRYGRWNWIDYYGWSWVGYEPWGWAPYHYGRWFHHPVRGWGWWPGYRHRLYSWRPALVAFFGYSGRNFSLGVGFGFGNVGWVPLAPYETFNPWYGRGGFGYGRYGGFGNRVNNTIIVDNSVNIYNTYRNARVNNGVTVVDANGFSRGQLNNPRSLRGSELQRASLVRGQIPVVPERGSLGQVVNRSARGNAAVAARASSVRTFSRSAGARTTPARPARTSFDQQRTQIATSVRDFRSNRGSSAGAVSNGSVRSRTRSTARGGVASGATRPTTGSVRSSTADSGFRRAGQPARGSAGAVRTPGTTSSRVGRTGDVRSSSRGSVATPGRSRTSATRSLPDRSSSRVGHSATRQSNERRATDPLIRPGASSRIPSSSSSRVNRSGSGSRTQPARARTSPSIPSSSSSRVNRTSPSRSRSGSSATTSRFPSSSSRSRVNRTSPSRSRSSSSATRSKPSSPSSSSRSRVSRPSPSSSRGGSVSRSRPSISPSRSSAPSRSRGSISMPSRSRSSSPSVRSAPRPSSSRSGGSFSRSRSSAPSVRSAPSRGSSGGVRSAPSRSRSSGGRRR